MDLYLSHGFIIVLFSIFCPTLAKNFVCEYKEKETWMAESKYACELIKVVNITSPKLATVSSVIGRHEHGKTNDDVILLISDEKGIDYFPQGLEKLFPNLNSISIRRNKMKEIRASDLEAYSKLIYLNIADNLIEVLEDGTFDYNPELEHLSFHNNKLVHVGLNVFNSLSLLSSLSFMQNICFNKKVENDSDEVQELIENVKVHCRDYEFLKFNGKIASLESECRHLNTQNIVIFEQNLKNLNFEIQNSKFSYITSFKARIQELRNQNYKFNFDQNFEDVKETNRLEFLIDELKINVQERFDGIQNDLQISNMYILKSVDMKIKELERHLNHYLDVTYEDWVPQKQWSPEMTAHSWPLASNDGNMHQQYMSSNQWYPVAHRRHDRKFKFLS